MHNPNQMNKRLVAGFVAFIFVIYLMSSSGGGKTRPNPETDSNADEYYYMVSANRNRMSELPEDVRCIPIRNLTDFAVDVFDFERFDNQKDPSTTDPYIVPNLVHLVYLNTTQLTYDHMITLFSIFLNHNPQRILIHCDECEFRGAYWQRVQATRCLREKLVVRKIPMFEAVYNDQKTNRSLNR